jgi:type I restriction enzyme S subunit
MTAERFLVHFDRISEAPDAIQHLRRFVLDLAVRGKLVGQDPKDEPASELLKRMRTEKARLVTEGKLKQTAIGSAGGGVNGPFRLPPSWAWGCLGDVAQYGLSDKVDLNKSIAVDTWVLDLEDIEKDTSRLIERMPSSARSFRSTKTIFKRGDVLFGKLRPYLNKVLVADQDGVCTTEIIPIRGYCGIVPEYVKLVLKSPLTMARVDRLMYGMKMPRLGTGDAVALSFPLPPLAEQHRIVAKVDELMALCDRLEATQAERENRRDRLVAASVHRMNNGADADASREHVRFHLRHLPRLTTRPEDIQQLRQTILNLAVRGNLVPQDPNDEPASELLQQIQTQKARLVKEGKIKPPPLPATPEDSMPFRLPTDWEWVRFGELIIDADAGWSPKSEGFPRSGVKWGVLKVSAVSWNKFLPEENKQLLPGIRPPEAAQVHAGDFLISRANTSELVAKCVVVDKEPRNLILSDKIVRLQIAETCSKKFLCMVNNHAEYARSYYAEEASGTSLSMKNVSRSVIYALAIPLPPFAEQHRIVAKVDELLALCDQLETQLTTGQTESRRLLEATLADALSGNSRVLQEVLQT